MCGPDATARERMAEEWPTAGSGHPTTRLAPTTTRLAPAVAYASGCRRPRRSFRRLLQVLPPGPEGSGRELAGFRRFGCVGNQRPGRWRPAQLQPLRLPVRPSGREGRQGLPDSRCRRRVPRAGVRLRSCSSEILRVALEYSPERFDCIVLAGFGGPLRDAQALGDLGHRQTSPEAEYDHDPLIGSERRHCAADRVAEQSGSKRITGIREIEMLVEVANG